MRALVTIKFYSTLSGLLLLLSFLFFTNPPVEICDNAIDDDGDGWIDFQDEDCICEFIEIRSLIPNPSFEQMNCCPDGHYRLDCTSSWIQAYGVTPDYIHTCGWMGPDEIQAPTPFPDGDGVIGFLNGKVPELFPVEPDWKEYAGTCLLKTMEAGKSYRIDFSLGFASLLTSPPLELTIYGTESCDNFPFGINVVSPGCPTNFPEWVRLEGKLLESDNNGPGWIMDSLEFTPDRDIKAIAIGGPCEPFVGDYSNYYFLDNLIMEETYLFQYQINERGDPCSDDFTLSVTSPATLAYQWYKDSIALVGEMSSELKVTYGDGHYQVRLIEADGCRMSPAYSFIKPATKNANIEATICEGETYVDGDFVANSEGDFQYTLPASSGCDSTINLTLTFCNLFLPNVFSPNGDGVNDIFKIFGEIPHDNYTIQIFNRWGGMVYQGLEWDGRNNGELAESGVYIYLVTLNNATGKNTIIPGSVTLIR